MAATLRFEYQYMVDKRVSCGSNVPTNCSSGPVHGTEPIAHKITSEGVRHPSSLDTFEQASFKPFPSFYERGLEEAEMESRTCGSLRLQLLKTLLPQRFWLPQYPDWFHVQNENKFRNILVNVYTSISTDRSRNPLSTRCGEIWG
jgi:hypothetical protein